MLSLQMGDFSAMEINNYISTESDICHGKPCFKGTRIMVAIVLELLEAGEPVEKILEAYPALTPAHIQAALHLASQLLEETYRFPPKAA